MFIMEETREESEENIIMFRPRHNSGFKQLIDEREIEPTLPQDFGAETTQSDYDVPVKTLGLWPLTFLVFYSVSG